MHLWPILMLKTSLSMVYQSVLVKCNPEKHFRLILLDKSLYKNKLKIFRPTDPNFFRHVSGNTAIYKALLTFAGSMMMFQFMSDNPGLETRSLGPNTLGSSQSPVPSRYVFVSSLFAR